VFDDNRLNFTLEAIIHKSKFNPLDYERGDDRRYQNMIFEGLASDNSEDFEGDSMEPNGFVLDVFKKRGLINLDHLPTRSPINKSRFFIGVPLEAKVEKNKFYLKCKLWSKSSEARAFYDTALEMEQSEPKRTPGFSIEGKALERDKDNPKHITKTLITNVALTMNPVNGNTYADIVKGIQKQDFYIPNGDFVYEDNLPLLKVDCGKNVIIVNKSLELSIVNKKEFSKDDFDRLVCAVKNGDVNKSVLMDYMKMVSGKTE
jgi:hypothetical protein